MKISYMRLREDFDKINAQTLDRYFYGSDKETKLYIYPHLNALVTQRPSKEVKRFLYTEYSNSGNFVKRILVWLYTRFAMNTGGMLAEKSYFQKGDITSDMLIYPCNKKYRIFDFKNKTVTVVVKSGFPNASLRQEVAFRQSHRSDFILPVLKSGEDWYTESVIDGCPLARTGEAESTLLQKTNAMWTEYIKDGMHTVNAKAYAEELYEKAHSLLDTVAVFDKAVRRTTLKAIEFLYRYISTCDAQIPLTMSHGDLQPGNIWIENETNKLYIIDWESAQVRSFWYDQALLYRGLRRLGGFEQIAKEMHSVEDAVVLFEDCIYRLEDVLCLPKEIRERVLTENAEIYNVFSN